MEKFGKVYLIGAGPGDPGLLTLRAHSILQKADVVVYDRLVSPSILGMCNPNAKMVDVGKMPTHHKVKQSEINKLLVKFACEMPGATIARLKGGDPFVFGRGGEEALELVAAGVEFEVVPGVTSAIAVPAYAGIPVSHRGIATSFHIVTGHEKDNSESRNSSVILEPKAIESIQNADCKDECMCHPESFDKLRINSAETEPKDLGRSDMAMDKPLGLDFSTLAHCPGTLIFLMGIGNMDFIARRLIECGKDPKTSLAFIEKGTTPFQRTVMATLETAGETIVREHVTAPAITIMGGVVELGKSLAWKKNLPLSGKRLVVTRAAKQASGITAKLTALGAEVIETPMIETRTLGCPMVVCHPERNVVESKDLTSHVIVQAHDSVGSAMSVGKPPDAALTSHVIPARHSGPRAGTLPESVWNSLAHFDLLAFTSVNGVESFFKQLFLAGLDIRVLAGKKIASVGKITEKKLLEYGIRCDYVPEDHTGEGLGKLLRSILDQRGCRHSERSEESRASQDPRLREDDEPSSNQASRLCEDENCVILSGAHSAESKDLKESRILLLQGNLADDTLLKYLPNATRWIVYETLPVAELPEWKREAIATADAVVFASTSAVENFCSLIQNDNNRHSERSEESSATLDPSVTTFPLDDEFGSSRLSSQSAVGTTSKRSDLIPHTSFCIGRMTEAAARKHGFETVTSDETTIDSLVKKIAEHYIRRKNGSESL